MIAPNNPASKLGGSAVRLSTYARNQFPAVVFLQLLAGSVGAASAQDLNLQNQMNQTAPAPQLPAPDFSVGRSGDATSSQTDHVAHTSHGRRKKRPAGD
jgi:hypothetical protein